MSITTKFRKIGAVLVALAAVGCSGGFETVSPQTSLSSNDTGGGNNARPVPTLSLSTTEAFTLNLGEIKNATVNLKSINGFAGSVTLTIDRTALNAIDPARDIEVVVEPNVVALTANQELPVVVRVTTKNSAPSFAANTIKLRAQAATVANTNAALDLPLQVNAVYELKMFGGPDPALRWDRPSLIQFRRHTGGLLLRFMNADPDADHTVHGARAIPHGDNLVKAPAAGQIGGIYEVRIAETQTQEGIYYYHDIESSAFQRRMMFNMDNALPAAFVVQSVDPVRAPASASVATGDTCKDTVGMD